MFVFLCHFSAVYPLRWVGSTFLHARSVRSYGVHVKRMKSAQRFEGVYWVMIRGASIGLSAQALKLQARCLRQVAYLLDAEAPADNL